jgi:hypothetical protein
VVADIAKLSVGREAYYYTRELATDHEQYLSGDGESPGRWYGAGATSLGLEGEASPGWIDRRLHVVHDWDSAVTQAEAAIAGQAAAVWPGTGLPGDVATLAGCGPAPSTPRRPASSAPIPPPHLPRLKLRNGHGLAVP